MFRSLDHAMRFAYQSEPRVVGASSLVGMMATDKREGAPSREEELDAPPPRAINFDLEPVPIGLNAAAQQGLIKSFVARRPAPARLHILAKWANGVERREAMRALRDHLSPFLEETFRPRYIIYVYVGTYYGQRQIDVRDLAGRALYLVPKVEGQNHANWVRAAERRCRELGFHVGGLLKDLGGRSEDDATVELKNLGVIA